MADHFERDIVPAPDGGFHRVGPWRRCPHQQGDPMSSSTLVRGHRRRRAQDAAATVAAIAIALVGTAVVLSPIVWGLISFWRWVL